MICMIISITIIIGIMCIIIIMSPSTIIVIMIVIMIALKRTINNEVNHIINYDLSGSREMIKYNHKDNNIKENI